MNDNHVAPTHGFVFSEKLYNRVKWVTTILLPAVSTFYFTLSGVWDLPYTTQVIGTLAALATFLGVLIGISTKSYNNSENRFIGDMVFETTEDGKKTFTLAFNEDPIDLELFPEVTFKIKKEE
jgi:hypothetical protein